MTKTCIILVALALTLLFPGAAHAAKPQKTAKVFLEKIYATYAPGQPPLEPQAKDADWLFDDELLSLIRQDQTHANLANEVPILNGDPICDCQEHGALKKVQITILAATNDQVSAAVAFVNDAKPVQLHYALVRADKDWKIHDIINKSDGSLHDLLVKQLAEADSQKEE